MIGYKVLTDDMKSFPLGFQYDTNKIYTYDSNPVLYEAGFHFIKNKSDVLMWLSLNTCCDLNNITVWEIDTMDSEISSASVPISEYVSWQVFQARFKASLTRCSSKINFIRKVLLLELFDATFALAIIVSKSTNINMSYLWLRLLQHIDRTIRNYVHPYNPSRFRFIESDVIISFLVLRCELICYYYDKIVDTDTNAFDRDFKYCYDRVIEFFRDYSKVGTHNLISKINDSDSYLHVKYLKHEIRSLLTSMKG